MSTGARDRDPWQDHLTYLEHLEPLLAGHDRAVPILVVATAGSVPGIDRQVIDHAAHSSLTVRDVEGFDRHDADGRPLSDHDAVALLLLI